jgi:hypothetical protein
MFEPLPLPKGSKTCSSSSDLGLCLSFGFRSLVGVSFSSFFSFLFLFGYQILCVVNALVKGEIEDHVWFKDRWMVASWFGSRDPMAKGIKCAPHGGKNSKMKSWTVSWLSLKTKVEPELRGSRVMSGDWRRLH